MSWGFLTYDLPPPTSLLVIGLIQRLRIGRQQQQRAADLENVPDGYVVHIDPFQHGEQVEHGAEPIFRRVIQRLGGRIGVQEQRGVTREVTVL